MTITPDMVENLRGSEVYDSDDEKVGKVGEVYVDNANGEPKWVTVNTGMFGSKETFVPLDGARQGTDGVHVAAGKKTIKDAPRTSDGSGELSESAERDLYQHYGLTDAAGTGRAHGDAHGTRDARAAGGADDARGGRDHGADTGSDQGMTVSEERLSVGTESVERGNVRLRKHVVTENQTVEVPVRHEEVRLEREPITDGHGRGGAIGEDEHSVTLHAERPVVSKETHPVERVRLATETVTEQHTVSDEVRKERVDVSDPDGVMASGKDRPSREDATSEKSRGTKK